MSVSGNSFTNNQDDIYIIQSNKEFLKVQLFSECVHFHKLQILKSSCLVESSESDSSVSSARVKGKKGFGHFSSKVRKIA